jgi:hypothetical protein
MSTDLPMAVISFQSQTRQLELKGYEEVNVDEARGWRWHYGWDVKRSIETVTEMNWNFGKQTLD